MKTTVNGIPGQVHQIEAEHPDLKNYDYPELMAVLGTLKPCTCTVTATASVSVLCTERSFKNLLGEIVQADTGGKSC